MPNPESNVTSRVALKCFALEPCRASSKLDTLGSTKSEFIPGASPNAGIVNDSIYVVSPGWAMRMSGATRNR